MSVSGKVLCEGRRGGRGGGESQQQAQGSSRPWRTTHLHRFLGVLRDLRVRRQRLLHDARNVGDGQEAVLLPHLGLGRRHRCHDTSFLRPLDSNLNLF